MMLLGWSHLALRDAGQFHWTLREPLWQARLLNTALGCAKRQCPRVLWLTALLLLQGADEEAKGQA